MTKVMCHGLTVPWIIEHVELDRKCTCYVMSSAWCVGKAFEAKWVTCSTRTSNNILSITVFTHEVKHGVCGTRAFASEFQGLLCRKK